MLVKLPGTSHFGVLYMGLNLSGFQYLLFLSLILLLVLFVVLLLRRSLLLLQGGAETMGELGNEVFVGGGEGEQMSRE